MVQSVEQLGYISSVGQSNSHYEPRSNAKYRRVDNGLYLVNTDASLSLRRAYQIHWSIDSSALKDECGKHSIPTGLQLHVVTNNDYVGYSLYNPNVLVDSPLWHGQCARVAHAAYSITRDELIDVRTIDEFRGRGISRALVAMVLKINGPSIIQAQPSNDCPMSLVELVKFYSSFPGYHAVPGTNKVVRLMSETYIEEAAGPNGNIDVNKPRSALQIAVLEENSKELKRIMSILEPMNDEEVDGLLRAQKTDILSLQTAMTIYGPEFFASRTWGRVHRVKFAQGMAALLEKYASRHYGVWDDIIAREAV